MRARAILIIILLSLVAVSQTWQVRGVRRDAETTRRTIRGPEKLADGAPRRVRIKTGERPPSRHPLRAGTEDRNPLGAEADTAAQNTQPSLTQEARVALGSITGTPPPSSGNWIINDTTIVEDSVLIINGSIVVNETGALILRNSSIYMNLSYDGEHCIDVYGNLTVLGSLITAYNTSNNYYIRVFSGARLRIEDSEISYAGYERVDVIEKRAGLWINTNGVVIKNTTMRNNYIAICINGSRDNIISYNTIRDNNEEGIYVLNSTNNTITHNKILNNTEGVYIEYSLSLIHI